MLLNKTEPKPFVRHKDTDAHKTKQNLCRHRSRLIQQTLQIVKTHKLQNNRGHRKRQSKLGWLLIKLLQEEVFDFFVGDSEFVTNTFN